MSPGSTLSTRSIILGIMPRKDSLPGGDHLNAVKLGDLRLPSNTTDDNDPFSIPPRSHQLISSSQVCIWLENCLETHAPCRNSENFGIFPTRVLDIRDPKSPVLVSGDGREERYATLSYKWGSAKRYFTTTKNLSERQTGIPFIELPATFRDAITVANRLNLPYLWIDALCIIQDSEKDKEREIQRMSQIFRWSTLTIFAATGDDADTGLAVQRDPRSTKPVVLDVKTTSG